MSESVLAERYDSAPFYDELFSPLGRGWVSLDPTHDQEQTAQYVRVAVGRDYADVPPTRGIFKGNAKEKMDVDVSVKVY